MSSARPGWMEGGARRPKPPQPPQPQRPQPASPSRDQAPPVDRQPEPIRIEIPDMPTTHRAVVIGVSLIAVMMLFSVFFWVGIGITVAFHAPESSVSLSGGIELVTLGDYLSLPRVFLGICTGVLGTIAAWFVADNLIEDPR